DERRGPPRGLRRAEPEGGLRRDDRSRDQGPPGVRLRGCRAHARPVTAAGGLGAHGDQPARGGPPRPPGPDARRLPADALLEDRPELQEARPARPQRRLARAPARGEGRHPVRGLDRHGRGVPAVRAGPGSAGPRPRLTAAGQSLRVASRVASAVRVVAYAGSLTRFTISYGSAARS